MSTLFGKINTGDMPLDQEETRLMGDVMNHWHADSVNIWRDDTKGMGHLMLFNSPESLHERLPLQDPLSGLAITADARIDNRDELYDLLGLSSAEEKKAPDSTLLLLLYKKYQERCASYIVGDFAFAIWDERKQQLFCARDHMGVRPFVYAQNHNFFAFASEKKGLLCLPGVDKSIDREYYYNCLFRPSIQVTDTTLYKQIKRLPAAHFLIWNRRSGVFNVQRYWTLDADKELRLTHREEYLDGLRAHIEAAVKCRLRSHFPVGAETSGGLDSSVITAIASQELSKSGRSLTTFSARLSPGDEATHRHIPHEHTYIDAVLRFNSIRDAVFVTENAWDDPVEEAAFMLKANDGIEIRAGGIMMPVKYAAMQHGVRSLLSGFPGDEMVTYRGQFSFLDHLDHGQYLQYFMQKKEQPFNKLKPLVPQPILFAGHKMRNLLLLTDNDLRLACRLLGIPMKELLRMGDIAWKEDVYLERYKSHRHYQKYRLLKSSTTVRLEGESCMGIPLRVETRFPMADIRLTQFYLSMPDELKSGGDLKRNMYRQAVAQYLPQEILERDNKYGHTVPFRSLSDYRRRKESAANAIVQQLNNGTHKYDVLLRVRDSRTPRLIINLNFLKWFNDNRSFISD